MNREILNRQKEQQEAVYLIEVSSTYAKVSRNLDGKGRLILPKDFREAAGFTPDEPVEIIFASIGGGPEKSRQAFIITKKRG